MAGIGSPYCSRISVFVQELLSTTLPLKVIQPTMMGYNSTLISNPVSARRIALGPQKKISLYQPMMYLTLVDGKKKFRKSFSTQIKDPLDDLAPKKFQKSIQNPWRRHLIFLLTLLFATHIPSLHSLAPNGDMVLVGLKYLNYTQELEICQANALESQNRGQGRKPYLWQCHLIRQQNFFKKLSKGQFDVLVNISQSDFKKYFFVRQYLPFKLQLELSLSSFLFECMQCCQQEHKLHFKIRLNIIGVSLECTNCTNALSSEK